MYAHSTVGLTTRLLNSFKLIRGQTMHLVIERRYKFLLVAKVIRYRAYSELNGAELSF